MALVGLDPCKKFSGATVENQLLKIANEINEAYEAHFAGDPEAVKEEVMDCMVACMTLLQVQCGMSEDDVRRLACKVNQKNAERGYHDGPLLEKDGHEGADEKG